MHGTSTAHIAQHLGPVTADCKSIRKQCNYCAIVCPHGVVRPFLFDREGQAGKPDGMVMKKAQGGAELAGLSYSINLATMDCTGCAVCVESCPDDALYMADFNEAAPQEVANWEYALQASVKSNPADKYTVKGSQFETPLLEFSGACAGCGETPCMCIDTLLRQLHPTHQSSFVLDRCPQ